MTSTGKPFFRITRTLALVALAIALTLVIGISTGFASRGLSPLRNMVAEILASETPYPTVTPVPTEEGLVDLYALDGDVIAQWSSEEPVTTFQVTSYEILELSLPHPVEVVVDGQTTNVRTAWKISISRSEPFTVTSLGYSIWIDDTRVVAREQAPGLVAFLFDPSPLREGARIGISPGDLMSLRQQFPVGLQFSRQPSP